MGNFWFWLELVGARHKLVEKRNASSSKAFRNIAKIQGAWLVRLRHVSGLQGGRLRTFAKIRDWIFGVLWGPLYRVPGS